MSKSKNIIFHILLLGFVLCASSCIKDEMEECNLYISFRYIYNMQNANGFAHEANKVDLYIFNSENQLVGQYSDTNITSADYSMKVPLPAPGEYHFVAWAKGDKESEMANFEIPSIERGGSPTALSARVRRNADNVAQTQLNSLLNGTLTADIAEEDTYLTIDMMKCTNELRVIVMPSGAGQSLSSENLDIRIEDKVGWLAYNGAPYKDDLLTYKTYFQTLEQSGETRAADAVIDRAVVADLSTSRIIYNAHPRLIISAIDSDREIVNVDLAWMLSLQAIGEHKSEWSTQEYLDRQDEFAITFFFDGNNDTWMRNRIVVNGWVLSIEENEGLR